MDELLELHEAKVLAARALVGEYLDALDIELGIHAEYRNAVAELPRLAEAAKVRRDTKHSAAVTQYRVAQSDYARLKSRTGELATCRPRVDSDAQRGSLEPLAARASVGDRQAVELLADKLCEIAREGARDVLSWRNLKAGWAQDPLQRLLERIGGWEPFTPRAVQGAFSKHATRQGAVTALLKQLVQTQLPYPKLDSKPPAMPQLPAVVPPKEPEAPPSIDPFRRWEGDLQSAWEGHLECLSPSYPNALLAGYSPVNGEPLFVPRSVFHDHAYITGPTGSGKTTGGVMPIFIQLMRGSDEAEGPEAGEPPPMLIVDMKGDPALFHTARLEASKRGKRFHLLTAMQGLESSFFDPFDSLKACWNRPQELADLLCEALELFHGTGYGAGYYTSQQSDVLAAALEQGLEEAQAEKRTYKPSLQDLAVRLQRVKNRDAKHVAAVVRALTREPFRTLLSPPSDAPEDKVVDMERVVGEREVVYVYVPAHRSTITGATVARFALRCLYHVVAEQGHVKKSPQCYAIVDEFQEFAAYNAVRIFRASRSSGLGLIMANQSVSDLVSPNMDLRSAVLTNTAYRQFFGASTLDDMELISRMSGEHKEILLSGSIQATAGEQDSVGRHSSTQRGGSLTQGVGEGFTRALRQQAGKDLVFTMPGEPRGIRFRKHVPGRTVPSDSFSNSLSWARASSEAHIEGVSESHADTRTLGIGLQFREVYRPRLTVDDLNAMTAQPLSSIVRVAVNSNHFSDGRSVAVQALYTTDKEEYDERSSTLWPQAREAQQGTSAAPPSDSERKLFGERADRLRALFGNRLP